MEFSTIGPFLSYYEKLRKRTLNVARLIPPDRIDWTYMPGKLTHGDLLRHMASIERYMYPENAQLKPSLYPGHGKELADGFDAVMEYFNRAHRESMEIFAALSDDDLQQECMTPAGAKLRLWKWLWTLAEHEIHHRGQIYIYLG